MSFISFIMKAKKGEERPGHKYIRRVPLPQGGYKYIYKEVQERTKRIIPVKKVQPKVEEYIALDPPNPDFMFDKDLSKDPINVQLMKKSDGYFNASASERTKLQRTAVTKLQSFVKFLRDNRLYNREDFKEFASTSNKDMLSRFFGLTDNEFNSESGDKLSNYVNVSFTKDGNYVTFNYADNFFFNSINKELAENRKPKWSLQMRMARGITFDVQTGELVSFPYEKFFNMGEYIDGDLANLAKKLTEQSAVGSEKVDGILIQAFYDRHNDKIRFGTRAQLDPDEKGFINTADKLAKKSGNYDKLKGILKNGKSMILELIDPKYRVVVGYGKKSALFLHGVRDLSSLEMQNFKDTQNLAKELNFETPNSYVFKNFAELVDFQKNTKEDLEGYVLRFEDGSMVKAKTESYFAKLKGLKALSHRIIGESILSGEDWNKFKYERIKSEELFDVADKYRKDVIQTGDKINGFLSGFVESTVKVSNWMKFGAQEKQQLKPEIEYAYQEAVKNGILDPEKVKPDDFRLAVNYLVSYNMKNNESDRTSYNKKLMNLTVDSLKTGAWMGSKLQGEEIQRSIVEMDLTKFSFPSMISGGPGQDIGDVGPSVVGKDINEVEELDEEERRKRKKQKQLED